MIYRFTDLSIYWSIDLSIYRSIDLSIYWSIDLSIYWSIDLLIYWTIDLLIYLLWIYRYMDLRCMYCLVWRRTMDQQGTVLVFLLFIVRHSTESLISIPGIRSSPTSLCSNLSPTCIRYRSRYLGEYMLIRSHKVSQKTYHFLERQGVQENIK